MNTLFVPYFSSFTAGPMLLVKEAIEVVNLTNINNNPGDSVIIEDAVAVNNKTLEVITNSKEVVNHPVAEAIAVPFNSRDGIKVVTHKAVMITATESSNPIKTNLGLILISSKVGVAKQMMLIKAGVASQSAIIKTGVMQRKKKADSKSGTVVKLQQKVHLLAGLQLLRPKR